MARGSRPRLSQHAGRPRLGGLSASSAARRLGSSAPCDLSRAQGLARIRRIERRPRRRAWWTGPRGMKGLETMKEKEMTNTKVLRHLRSGFDHAPAEGAVE